MIDVQKLARDAAKGRYAESERDAHSLRFNELEAFAGLVLEAAALECETVALQANAAWKLAYQLQDQGRELGADDCASAIRALKPNTEAVLDAV